MPNDVVITIKGVDQASKVIGGVEKKAGGLGSALSKAGTVAGGFLAAGAVTAGVSKLTGFLSESVKMAAAEDAQMTQLMQTYKNAGGPMGDFNKWVNANIESSLRLGFADDITRDMLNKLTYETGSAAEAQSRLAIAQDITRATGLDAATVAKLLGKMTDENVNVFKKMGIVLDKNATKEEAMAALQKRFGGQAAAYAKTTAGALDIQTAKMDDMKEELGAKLLPVQMAWSKLQIKIADFIIGTVIPAISKYKEVAVALAAAVGLIATALIAAKTATMAHTLAVNTAKAAQVLWKVAIGAWSLATKAAAAAQWLLNAAMTANPIGAAVVAVTAITAGLVYFFTQTELGQKIIATAWATIQSVFQTVFNWVKTNWPLLLAILAGPFGLAVLAIIKKKDEILGVIQGLWGGIKSAFQTVFEWVKANWPLLLAILGGPFGLVVLTIIKKKDEILGIIGGLWKSIRDTASGAGTSIANAFIAAFKAAWNAAANTINKAIPDKISIPLAPDINLPDNPVPRLATGGLVTKTGLAMVDRGETFSGVGKPGGLTVNLYVQGSILSENDIKRVITDAIRAGGFRGLALA